MAVHLFAISATLMLCPTLFAEGARVDRFDDPLPPGAVRRLGSDQRDRHLGTVESLHFMANGMILLSIGGDARTWNVATGALLHLAPAEDERTKDWKIGLLEFAADKRTIVSRRFGCTSSTRPDPRDPNRTISESRTFTQIWTWHLNENAQEPARIEYAEPGNIAALLRDPRKFVIARPDSGKLQIYDTETNEVLNEIDAHKGAIWQSEMIAAGRFYLTRDDDSVCLWNTDTWQELRRLPLKKNEGGTLAISDQGHWLARVWKGRLEMWNLRDGRITWQIADALSDEEIRLAFAPDGKTLAVLSDERQLLDIWDTSAGKRLREVRTHDTKDKAEAIRFGRAALEALGYDTPRSRAIYTLMVDKQFQRQTEEFSFHLKRDKPDQKRVEFQLWNDEIQVVSYLR